MSSLINWTRTAGVVVLGIVACSNGCSSNEEAIFEFRCNDPKAAGCPFDSPCPEMPLDTGGCDELPVRGAPATTGRPIGCSATRRTGEQSGDFCQCVGVRASGDSFTPTPPPPVRGRWECLP